MSSFGPFCFGNPPEHQLHMLKVGLEANKLTHSLIKAKVHAKTVANTVHDYIRKCGLGDHIVYGPAHAIGMMECEYPFIESTSDYTLEEGMTFAVDTFLAGRITACAMRTPSPCWPTAKSSSPLDTAT